MKYYSAAPLNVAGFDVLLARTGYTGEDGYELYLPNTGAGELWDALLNAGAAYDLLPAGLAARDSLRLEAGMPLYGQELGTDITPVEAGMARAFAGKEADFVGRAALDGREPESAIVGLKGLGRRAAREGAEVFREDEKVGVVTSGQPSPVLGHPIALARLHPEFPGRASRWTSAASAASRPSRSSTGAPTANINPTPHGRHPMSNSRRELLLPGDTGIDATADAAAGITVRSASPPWPPGIGEVVTPSCPRSATPSPPVSLR